MKCHFCDQEASSNKEQVGTCDACWEKYKPRPGTPPKNWKKGCQAAADRTSLFCMDRCGKEPTRPTAFGPMCDECWKELRETTREGRNLLGMLQGYPKKAKDESRA